MQPLDEEPLVEPAYAQAPTFGAREPAPVAQQAPRYAQPAYEEPAYDDEPAYEEPVHAAEPEPAPAPVEKIWQDVYVINLMARPGHDLQGRPALFPAGAGLQVWRDGHLPPPRGSGRQGAKCSSP